jgi:hypothetical protein
MKNLTLWAALLCMIAFAQAADKLVGGPYVVKVGPRSATVAWIVQTGQVALGTSSDKPALNAPVLHSEKVSYTGLRPGTTYYYDVMGREEGKGQFKTAPIDPVPFEFVVYGDTRTRHDVHQRIINAIINKARPDFVLHTGDLVADGVDSAQWPIFFGIEKELLRNTAFFPSLGNHERNNPQYYEFFDVKTPYYSFNWGSSHFIVLNSDIGNAAVSTSGQEAYWTEQVRWLEEDLAKSQKADFRFVFAHHPPITAVRRRQGGNPEMTALMPLFEKYKLTAGFFGHDHNYQHHLKNGVHYVVTGGGGAPLYDVDVPSPGVTQKVESIEHFVQVKVNGAKARIEAYAIDGHLLDGIDLEKYPPTKGR